MKATVVPFRNGIMLSIAAGLAESLKMERIAIANHDGDHAIYLDCREVFISAMAEAVSLGTYAGVKLYAPFTKLSKSEVLQEGVRCKAPVNETWSCYQPHFDISSYIQCGRCSTCVERIEAFILAGIEDETEYADTEFAIKLLKEKGSI
jgi:7-cyano-7-deazaguanine synthase